MKPHANDKHTDTMNISVFCGMTLSCNNEIVKPTGNPTILNHLNI